MRPIDADAVHITGRQDTSLEFDAGVLYAIDHIAKMPTIEVPPSVSEFKRMAIQLGYKKEKHSHWTLEHESYGAVICSECRKEALLEQSKISKQLLYVESDYCPHCGAKMYEEVSADTNG